MPQKKVFDVGIFDDMIFDAEELGIPNELEEGVYDKGIFKAVILVGGPGSGKSAFSRHANLTAKGFKPVVSDDIFEYVREKQGKSLDLNSEDYGADRDYAKPIARRREFNYLEGRLPIFYETSLSNVGKAKNEVRIVRRMGYEVFVVYVKTAPDLALSRNDSRPRKLPQKWVKDRMENIPQDFLQYRKIFKSGKGMGFTCIHTIDNNKGITALNRNMIPIVKKFNAWFNRPIKNKEAIKWVKQSLERKNRLDQ